MTGPADPSGVTFTLEQPQSSMPMLATMAPVEDGARNTQRPSLGEPPSTAALTCGGPEPFLVMTLITPPIASDP